MATGLENIINPTVNGELGGADVGRATVNLAGDRTDFGRIDNDIHDIHSVELNQW